MSLANSRSVTTWRNAVFVVFTINGLGFSSWLARVPAIRDGLEISTSQVAGLLFTGALGAVGGLVFSSHVIAWLGHRHTILFFGLIGLVVGILSDLMYVLVDPRIDFEKRKG